MEQLARNRAFFGDDGLSKIRGSFVIVVGAGGVGSWAATMLARSGVGKSTSFCLSIPIYVPIY
jgi:tRNA A37 threonylcarbamoyladenosine dehydratase